MDKISQCIEIGSKLYYIMNPTSKMDVPSYFYQKLEKQYDNWISEKSSLSFFDYCNNK